ncbi:hypothetical protein SARC_01660 [Sphaeroforma arctica JP610]|uniref:Cyclin C-terminal domain-containing protein n=1 Tax=Sphaeroforma arctica JP610 TaxID=667725 RepID=A0A0L0GAZ1_9EUKA|nr:hypothetical protein SARC_01660 [Sphaeroforma arctica JP610]KNC86182.1 hypothetical protein SARC_01660 [Sphaeroforma arctica JP610]|eukprot:XP_014160084.1 hypothetical protein SARC_01660 [Sphaeroforma arctica JP610]
MLPVSATTFADVSQLSSSEPLRARGKEPIFNSKHHSAIGGQLLQSEVNVLQTIDYETTYTTNYDVMQFLLASFRPSQTAEERMAMGAHCEDLLELAMFTSGYFSTPGACAAGVIAVAEYLSPRSADSDSTVAILMQLAGYAKGDIELCAVQLIDYLSSAYRATN